ncbi:MAG: DNA primase [candidate division WOR-3 bacterium]
MDRDFVEKVREATDITQLMAERGIRLTRSGRRLKALCPFHREKTPSFYVEPDLGLYYCFGCGASGDAIKFVMESEGLSFPDALDYLAERFGVPKPETPTSREKPRPAEALDFALRFYHERLFSPEGRIALEYLKSRGITAESINDFAIGYAPSENALLRAAHDQGFGVDELAAGGLVHRGPSGAWFDFFRNRIVFPVYSPSGKNILGFSGRTLGGDEPKYLNTPETQYFKKGELLYGLWRSRQEMRKTGSAALVEGNLDVVLSHQAGLKNAVAPLGTALTPSQARLLRKYSDKVIIAFDGDNAGRLAARRAIPYLVQNGLLVKVARLPEGEDPASLVAGENADALRVSLESAPDWIEFLFSSFYDSSLEGKKGFEREIMEILRPLLPEEREAYLSAAREILGYGQDWVSGVNQRLSSQGPVKKSADEEKCSGREVFFIAHAIARSKEKFFSSVLSLLEPEDLNNPAARRLLELWREGKPVAEIVREEGLGEMVSAVLTAQEIADEDLKMSFAIMVFDAIRRQKARIAKTESDPEAANAALSAQRLMGRIKNTLEKIRERKVRYPERRKILLERLWEIWEKVSNREDGSGVEAELDRLDLLLSRINEPVWNDEK